MSIEQQMTNLRIQIGEIFKKKLGYIPRFHVRCSVWQDEQGNEWAQKVGFEFSAYSPKRSASKVPTKEERVLDYLCEQQLVPRASASPSELLSTVVLLINNSLSFKPFKK